MNKKFNSSINFCNKFIGFLINSQSFSDSNTNILYSAYFHKVQRKDKIKQSYLSSAIKTLQYCVSIRACNLYLKILKINKNINSTSKRYA